MSLAPAARIGAALSALAAVVTAITALACAAAARRLLGFGFGGVPPTLGSAVSIFAENGRITAGIFVAALIAQLPCALGRDPGAEPASPLLAVRYLCDGGLLTLIALNVALVGGAFGAYGWRMVGVVLPHGPVEVAGYCVALALYLEARRRPLRRAEWVQAVALSFGLLAVAAAMEALL